MKSGQYIILTPENTIDMHKFRKEINKLADERACYVIRVDEIYRVIERCEI